MKSFKRRTLNSESSNPRQSADHRLIKLFGLIFFREGLIQFFNHMVYMFLFMIFILNSLKYSNVVDCIMDSFQNASQLQDPVYGAQATQNCWCFDIHPDNFMRYGPNNSTLYVRKHTKSNSRPVEFYQRQSDETEFLKDQVYYPIIWNTMMQVGRRHKLKILSIRRYFKSLEFTNQPSAFLFQIILVLISAILQKLSLCKKIRTMLTILRYGCLLHLIVVLKLATYGQYSSILGFRYEDLFTFPSGHMEVDSLPANYTRSTFIPEDVKIVNGDLYSPTRETVFFYVIMVSLTLLAYLHVRKIRAAKGPKKSTANSTKSNSGTKDSALNQTSETGIKSVSNGSQTASPSTEDDSVSIPVGGDSTAKKEHVITVGEIEV